ncbi:MAG: glycosyltransferase family 9 protein [Elusimicrobiota bacterium]
MARRLMDIPRADRPNVLIVKTGALGDVARTTPLLRALNANVYWLAGSRALEILPRPALAGAWDLSGWCNLPRLRFDMTLSLEEDVRAACVAKSIPTRRFIGVFADKKGRIGYTESSAAWFDMGIFSRFGRTAADALKKKNKRSYQDILFQMAGIKFSGEEYWINDVPTAAVESNPRTIGVEPRVGARWPNKAWFGYGELVRRARRDNLKIKILRQRRSLSDYAADIAACDIVVSGDTLAMHLALALKKRVVAIFLCTSPAEIHGYGRMRKIVSPRLNRHFYRTNFDVDAISAVDVDEVFAVVKNSLRRAAPEA